MSESPGSSRASASGRSSTGSPASTASAGSCSTTARASSSRSRARRPRSTRSRPASASEAPPLARVDAVAAEPASAAGETDFSIERSAATGRTALIPPDVATCDDCLRELFDPRRPPLPLPVRQLHAVRAALHDRARRALRPAEHDDGRLPALRRLPPRVRGPGRPPLPRRADRLPGLRTAALAAARGGGRAAPLPDGDRSPSRGSAATTSPATRRARRPSRGCVRASTARTSRSR